MQFNVFCVCFLEAISLNSFSDYIKKRPLFSCAADMAFLRGEDYWYGLCEEKNPKKALTFFRIAAQKGHSRAQTYLAMAYEEGLGVRKNMSRACELYEKAITSGDAFSRTCFGLMLISCDQIKRGIALIEMAAKSGNSAAQFHLGYHYLSENNMKMAHSWLIRSANQMNEKALFYVGMLYLDGVGVKIDEGRAYQYILESAKIGFADAQFRLSILCREGIGTEKSEEDWIKWLRAAVKQNHPDAVYAAGIYHLEKDEEKQALEYIETSAKLGHPSGQYLWGILCLEGMGTEKNEREGMRWLQCSAEQGFRKAQDEIASRLDLLAL
jgi:TPR repeat protein